MPRAGLRSRTSAASKDVVEQQPQPRTTRRVSGRKRKSEVVEEEEGIQLSESERLKQKAKYEGMLEEFDLEVERKVKSLRSQADDSFLSIRNALQVELVKLPKVRKIRNMTLREFKAKYGSLSQPPTSTSTSTNTKPIPVLLRGVDSIFTMMDGTKLDLSGVSVGDFDTKARKDILSRLNSAITQVQNFTVEK